jgi:hypothetical protein
MIPYPQSWFPKAICPNARLETPRRRVAGEVAVLNPDSELDALEWIEGVADDIDAPACRLPLRFRPTYEKYEERPELSMQALV